MEIWRYGDGDGDMETLEVRVRDGSGKATEATTVDCGDDWSSGRRWRWRCGDMEIWRYGDMEMEIWRYGEMERWRY